MFQVQKLVQRSSLNRKGKTMYCDSSVNFGLMADEGMVKLSHLDPRSLAMTNLDTGTSHFFLSKDTSIGLSSYLLPFLYPLAFCYQNPPNCILIYFPPGVVQKLTTSSLKQSPVFCLISWQNLFQVSCGPSVMMPLVKGMYFSTFLIWERSSSTLWLYLDSANVKTQRKNLFHPSKLYPSRLDTCNSPLFSSLLLFIPFPVCFPTFGDTINSFLFSSESPIICFSELTLTGKLQETSEEEVAISSVISMYPLTAHTMTSKTQALNPMQFDISIL